MSMDTKRSGNCMIRKESTEGIGYSVVGLNDVCHVFASAVPRTGSTLQEQAHDALRTIEAVMREEQTHGTIVRQAVFMRQADQFKACRKIMRDFYGDELPATTYIPQSPCNGKLLSIEAFGVSQGPGEVKVERFSERVVTATHDGITWIHCAQIMPETLESGIYNRTVHAFESMRELLSRRNVDFDKIMRTWLYLGDIVGDEGEVQRYKELNRARTDFFDEYRFCRGHVPAGFNGSVYPASTGIGTDDQDVLMSCLALDTQRDDVVLLPLENPQQVSSFDYSSAFGQKSPKFARAMAMIADDSATTFVSGTASITDAESRFIGDVEGQTHLTLDNIAALTSEDNFSRYGYPGLGASLDDLALVRVYTKYQEDYEKTRAVCQERLGELPIIYVVADVCRPELLVEIEGIAFSQRSAT